MAGRPTKYATVEEFKSNRKAYMKAYMEKNKDKQQKYRATRNRTHRINRIAVKMAEAPDEWIEAMGKLAAANPSIYNQIWEAIQIKAKQSEDIE